MATTSVQGTWVLNSLSLGSSSLAASHQDMEPSLTGLLNQAILASPKVASAFNGKNVQFSLEENGLTLSSTDGGVLVKHTIAERDLPADLFGAFDGVCKKACLVGAKVQKTLNANETARANQVNEAAKTVFSNMNQEPSKWRRVASRVSGAASVGNDMNSLTRNTVAAIPGVATKLGAPILYSMLGTGVAIFGVGARLAHAQMEKGVKAYENKDWEGLGLATVDGSTGAGLSLLGGAVITSSVATLKGAAQVAATAGNILTGAGIPMYGLLLLSHSYSLCTKGAFRSQFNGLVNEKENGLVKALNWMRQEITLSDFEVRAILAKTQKPEDQKKEIERALTKKFEAFQRRVGAEALKMVKEMDPQLLVNVLTGDEAAIRQAGQIIEKVSEGNFKEIAKEVLLVVISIIGVLAFVASLVFTGGLSHILFAIASGLWLFMDSETLHTWFGDTCWNLFHKKVVAKPAASAHLIEASS